MLSQKRDYDHWADPTNDPEWNWDSLLKDFKAH